MKVVDLVMHTNFGQSKTKVRRLIEQNAIKINDQPVDDINASVYWIEDKTYLKNKQSYWLLNNLKTYKLG